MKTSLSLLLCTCYFALWLFSNSDTFLTKSLVACSKAILNSQILRPDDYNMTSSIQPQLKLKQTHLWVLEQWPCYKGFIVASINNASNSYICGLSPFGNLDYLKSILKPQCLLYGKYKTLVDIQIQLHSAL